MIYLADKSDLVAAQVVNDESRPTVTEKLLNLCVLFAFILHFLTFQTKTNDKPVHPVKYPWGASKTLISAAERKGAELTERGRSLMVMQLVRRCGERVSSVGVKTSCFYVWSPFSTVFLAAC